MYELALIYVKRCRAAYGTTHYLAFRKIADRLITQLPPEEQSILTDLLDKTSHDAPLFSTPITRTSHLIENYSPRLAVSPPALPHEPASSMIDPILFRTLQFTSLVIKQLINKYTKLKALDDFPEDNKGRIKELYLKIESLEIELINHFNEAYHRLGYLNNDVYQVIVVRLYEAMFFMVSEYPQAYAYHYLDEFKIQPEKVLRAVFELGLDESGYFDDLVRSSFLELVLLSNESDLASVRHFLPTFENLKTFHLWALPQCTQNKTSHKALTFFCFEVLRELSDAIPQDPVSKKIMEDYQDFYPRSHSMFFMSPESGVSLKTLRPLNENGGSEFGPI